MGGHAFHTSTDDGGNQYTWFLEVCLLLGKVVLQFDNFIRTTNPQQASQKMR